MFGSLQRKTIWAVNFAFLAAFCAQAAYWTWSLFSPEQLKLVPQSSKMVEQRVTQTIASYHVFGGGETTENAALPPGLSLEGVFASKQGEPAAIFSEAGKKSRVVLLKEAVSPGVYLDEVAADHVVLSHEGGRTTVNLRQIAPELDLRAK